MHTTTSQTSEHQVLTTTQGFSNRRGLASRTYSLSLSILPRRVNRRASTRPRVFLTDWPLGSPLELPVYMRLMSRCPGQEQASACAQSMHHCGHASALDTRQCGHADGELSGYCDQLRLQPGVSHGCILFHVRLACRCVLLLSQCRQVAQGTMFAPGPSVLSVCDQEQIAVSGCVAWGTLVA